MAKLPLPGFRERDKDKKDYESEILGFCNDAIEEGEQFLKAQQGYGYISESIDSIMSVPHELISSKLSKTQSNRFAKVARDYVALLSDTRPFWEYKAPPQSPYEQQATNLGRLAQHWYTQRQIDMRFMDVLRYHTIAGSGFAYQYYNEDMEDLDMSAEDPRDVLPIRPSGFETLQNCLGVAIRRQRTTNFIKQTYNIEVPAEKDGSIKSNPNSRADRMLGNIGSPFWAELTKAGQAKRELPKIPTVDLFTLYLRDDRRNEHDYPVQIGQFDKMGKPLNNWSYIVEPGEALYPRKRCIEFTRSRVLYDGPSIYWHGMFPISKLSLDPWPWSWLGKAPMWDLLPLQRSLTRLLRIVDNMAEQIAQPNLIADKNSISEGALNKINTAEAGLKMRINPLAGRGVTIEKPNPIDQSIIQQVEWIKNEMNDLAGVRDLSQLMKLNQVPADDTVSRIQESMSPAIRSQSRCLEAFMREFGTISAYNFIQFYTVPMRIAVLGPYSITPEDLDFDPGSMIPDFVHREDRGADGLVKPEALARGPLPRYDRAREFMRQFMLNVVPGSLLSASEIERRLLYLQLGKMGWVDQRTCLEVLGIPNIDLIRQRLMQDQLVGSAAMSINSAGTMAGSNGAPSAPGGAGSNAGRKQTDQTTPRLVMKTSQ